MTLIMGMRSSDGVILAADRKVMRGGEPSYSDKIFEKAGVALAFEGLTGLRDDFLLLLDSELLRARGAFGSLYEVKVIVEDIITDLSKRYRPRLGQDAGMGAILGGLSGISRGNAQLYYVHTDGYGEAIDFMCSGHGEDYATSLAKFLYERHASTVLNAFRAAYVIAWVSEDVDSYVGGTPQVAIIRDGDPAIQQLSGLLVERASKAAKRAQKNLSGLLRLPKNL